MLVLTPIRRRGVEKWGLDTILLSIYTVVFLQSLVIYFLCSRLILMTAALMAHHPLLRLQVM
jgi:hypothetical protein